MGFWDDGVIVTAGFVVVMLILAELALGWLPPLRRVGVPASIVAGVLGLVVGPQCLGIAPVDGAVLESAVYHGLGIVFITVALQAPRGGASGPGARAMAFGITSMVALQTVVGLLLVLAVGALSGGPSHPGFGLLLPMSFEQGPGQALSLGAAWERGGLPDGAQVGLIMAAIGFAWSIAVGVPLVAWGRARGHVASAYGAPQAGQVAVARRRLPPGAADILTRQVLAIGGIYLATYLVCFALATALARLPDIAAMAWGFHFIFGGGIALAVRPLLARLPDGGPLDDELLGRISAVTVDVITCAALAAVQLGVLTAHVAPILVITTVGGLATLAFVIGVARRAFPEAWFEHAVLWYGLSTGTLPMGLALLRIIDPELRSPAPISAVFGSAGAVLGVAPIVLFIHPIPIAGWPDDATGAGALALGLSLAYLAGTLGVWWWGGGLARRVASS